MTDMVFTVLDLTSKVAAGIVVAAATAYLAFRWSMRRFVSERRWERKLDAYAGVLGSLHDMQAYPERYIDREILGHTISESEQAAFSIECKQAYAAVRRQADIGTLIISAAAVDALSLLDKELDRARSAETIFEHADAQLAAIHRCLEAVREAALNDLRIERNN